MLGCRGTRVRAGVWVSLTNRWERRSRRGLTWSPDGRLKIDLWDLGSRWSRLHRSNQQRSRTAFCCCSASRVNQRAAARQQISDAPCFAAPPPPLQARRMGSEPGGGVCTHHDDWWCGREAEWREAFGATQVLLSERKRREWNQCTWNNTKLKSKIKIARESLISSQVNSRVLNGRVWDESGVSKNVTRVRVFNSSAHL